MAADIDDEVRKLIRAAHSEARRILETHRPALDRMVEALLEKETLDMEGIEEVLHDVPKVARHRHPRDAPSSTPGNHCQ